MALSVLQKFWNLDHVCVNYHWTWCINSLSWFQSLKILLHTPNLIMYRVTYYPLYLAKDTAEIGSTYFSLGACRLQFLVLPRLFWLLNFFLISSRISCWEKISKKILVNFCGNQSKFFSSFFLFSFRACSIIGCNGFYQETVIFKLLI